jgi:hypothetical protein
MHLNFRALMNFSWAKGYPACMEANLSDEFQFLQLSQRGKPL